VTPRVGSRLAWAASALSVASVAAAVALWFANHFGARALVADGTHLNGALIALTFSAVGALIVSRRPGNTVGWIFCLSGLLSGVTEVATSYAVYVYASRPALPGGELAASVGGAGWVPTYGVMVLLLLLFPDGRPLSPRWAPASRLAGVGVVLATAGVALHPHAVLPQEGLHLDNPYAIPAAKDALVVMTVVGAALILGSMVAGVAALVLRWRRSSGSERLQLKWFTYAATVIAAFVLASINVSSDVLLGAIQAVLIGPALAVATGIAILRHRLYDIDVVINRTLVYGTLTAALGATYLGLVLLIGLTLGTSNVAVAVSTLAVAALFRPARTRIQAAVDRRFYRRRYDAARTLQTFGSRLRDEVDLDALQAELVGVVGQTVQPAHVTLWLPPDRRTT
jgi:hypothetical protein